MKNLVTVNGLCLTYIILFIDLCIGAFSSQTTFNDSYPVQFIIIPDQNDGRVVNSPFK